MASINRMKLNKHLSTKNILIMIAIILLTTISLSSAKPTTTTSKLGENDSQLTTTKKGDGGLGKRSDDGDTCYANCKLVERLCYEGIEKENEGAGMQEMVICMQSTDGCKVTCDEMILKATQTKRNVVGDVVKQTAPSINDVEQSGFVDGTKLVNLNHV